MLTALYMTRRGAGCRRTISNYSEAEKLLKGGFNATTVEIKDEKGEIVGVRWKQDGRWNWVLDPDAFV